MRQKSRNYSFGEINAAWRAWTDRLDNSNHAIVLASFFVYYNVEKARFESDNALDIQINPAIFVCI